MFFFMFIKQVWKEVQSGKRKDYKHFLIKKSTACAYAEYFQHRRSKSKFSRQNRFQGMNSAPFKELSSARFTLHRARCQWMYNVAALGMVIFLQRMGAISLHYFMNVFNYAQFLLLQSCLLLSRLGISFVCAPSLTLTTQLSCIKHDSFTFSML